MKRICFEITDDVGPALHSAVDEISNEVGGRLEGAHRFKKEDALTRAMRGLGTLRAAIFKAFPHGDPDYAK